ncbi:hypothetical protein DFH09DRAFT_195081 [Mycena vulgaris]|nr:hypothetical protein DFH09DRAFT_195081 [Mycena vulgaris]
MITQRPSAILRCRLLPQTISISNVPSRNTGFTHISEGQVVQAKQLSAPTRWSIAPDLGNKLIEALENDLDLLPQHPTLNGVLTQATLRLVNDWSDLFGDDTACDYDQQESATTDASRLLLLGFGTAAFRAIQTSATTAGTTTSTAQLKFRPKLGAPAASSFKIDNTLCLNSAATQIMGMEDKHASLLPWASMQLARRGLNCGVVDVEKDAPKHQPNWWVMANKGALYTAAYDMDWVVFGGMTVYCVGYRTGHHMLWCPVYNRRDSGNEVIPQTAQALAAIFPEESPPSDPQTGLPLLFLAIILKGIIAKGGCSWLPQMFAHLSSLTFAIPPGKPNVKDYTAHGRDPSESSGESSSDSGNDGDENGDFTSDSSRHSDNSSRITRSSGSTTLVSGQHRITGTWFGELAQYTGFSADYGASIRGSSRYCLRRGTG